MGVLVATTAALVLWIVLWAIGFGRTGDGFIVSVPVIVTVAATVRVIRRAFGPPGR